MKFPADVEASGDVKNLIRKLLTDRCYRLEFEGIKCHAFFANVNWNDLGSGEHMILHHKESSFRGSYSGGGPWRSGKEEGRWGGRKKGRRREEVKG